MTPLMTTATTASQSVTKMQSGADFSPPSNSSDGAAAFPGTDVIPGTASIVKREVDGFPGDVKMDLSLLEQRRLQSPSTTRSPMQLPDLSTHPLPLSESRSDAAASNPTRSDGAPSGFPFAGPESQAASMGAFPAASPIGVHDQNGRPTQLHPSCSQRQPSPCCGGPAAAASCASRGQLRNYRVTEYTIDRIKSIVLGFLLKLIFQFTNFTHL